MAIVIVFDVAVLGETQLAVLVITHVTVLPAVKLLFEYVVLFDPTLLPFNFH